MSRGIPPEAADILGRPDIWRGISRDSALAWLSSGRVAVVYTNYGFRSAAWFGPDSPFFQTYGPYDYTALRYFIFTGGGAGGATAGAKGGAAPRPRKQQGSKPQEEDEETVPLEQSEEYEEMEEVGPSGGKPNPFLKTTGQAALGVAKIPPKPEIPKKPDLAKPEIPKIPDKPALPEIPKIPEQPKLPERPEIPEIPDKPALPKGPEIPEIPEVPEQVAGAGNLIPKDDKPKTPQPVEIKLTTPLGKPLAKAAFELTFPDGKVEKGETDADGFIRFPDNMQSGDVTVVLTDFKG